jgi:Sigma-70, region 4
MPAATSSGTSAGNSRIDVSPELNVRLPATHFAVTMAGEQGKWRLWNWKVIRTSRSPPTNPPEHRHFEFQRWMALLDSSERELITLRYIEQWQYHEIAADKAIPIGTVQWRVFNAKKKWRFI